MKLSALLAPLMAAKAPHDQIMAVIVAYEAQQADALEKRRAADADRQARKRERDLSRDVTLRHSDSPLMRDRVAPVDDKQKPIDTSSSQNTTSKDHSEFRAALAPLDADQLTAFIKHRKTKKAQITGHAARLFLKDVAACGLSVSEAIDLCIGRNWITVKPEYLTGRQARGSPPRQPNLADAFAEVATLSEIRNDPRHHASDESPRGAISYLSRVQGG